MRSDRFLPRVAEANRTVRPSVCLSVTLCRNGVAHNPTLFASHVFAARRYASAGIRGVVRSCDPLNILVAAVTQRVARVRQRQLGYLLPARC